jgi:thiamine pyrophosphate-dependent acetolactate synthase large subunit-like protein
MGKLHGGQIVARYLKEVEDIETVFSLTGGHITPIYDGCPDYGVRLIDVRHEQAAVMMAHSWSIYTGKPGVCLVTAGPGFTNSLTGVVNACMENHPLVIISGMTAISGRDKGALQEMDQPEMVRSVVKWTGRCYETERIPEYLEMAFRYAVSNRPGPTFLEIPPDALYPTVEEEEVYFPGRGALEYEVAPSDESIKEAADLINGAERPLLLGGGGVGLSRCDEELVEFVRKTGVPNMLFSNGRGIIPDDDPLSIWDGGFLGLMAGLSMADVVLAVGVRFNWLFNFGEPMANAKVIRVDIDAAEVNRNRKADVALVGDAGVALKMLNKLVKEKDHSAWVDSLKGTFGTWTEPERQQKETPSDPIHPFRLMHQIRQATNDDATFIVDGGDTIYFAGVGLVAKERAGVIGSGLQFGCLGTGLPFAIGAKVARPDRPVVLVTGDGSFGLNAMELDTAVRHCVPVVCIICNDQAWGSAKHGHEMLYSPERVYGCDLGVVHYEQIAEAVGGHGEFVTRDEEIIPAIERAMNSGKPACVNVMTDPTVTSPATFGLMESLKH